MPRGTGSSTTSAGFPDELYHVQYPTEGDAEVARILARQLAEYEAQLDAQWGLDHGTWSVLKHLAPEPDDAGAAGQHRLHEAAARALRAVLTAPGAAAPRRDLHRQRQHRACAQPGQVGRRPGVGLGRAVRCRHRRGAARTPNRPAARPLWHVGGGPRRGADRRPLPADGGGAEPARPRRGNPASSTRPSTSGRWACARLLRPDRVGRRVEHPRHHEREPGEQDHRGDDHAQRVPRRRP